MPTYLDFNDSVPEIVDPVVTVSHAEGDAQASWSEPKEIVREHFAGVVATDGIEALDATKITDNEIEGAAFTWKTGAGTSQITFSFAGPRAFQMLFFHYLQIGSQASIIVSHSDDGVTFTPVASILQLLWSDVTYQSWVARWASAGAHAFWRVARTLSSAATPVTEMVFASYGPELSASNEVELIGYDVVVRGQTLKHVPAADRPTADRPLSIREALLWPQSEAAIRSAGFNGIATLDNVRIVTVVRRDATTFRSHGYELYGDDLNTTGKSVAVLQSTAALPLTGGSTYDLISAGGVGPPQLELSLAGAGTVTLRGYDSAGCTGGELLRIFVPAGMVVQVNNEDIVAVAVHRFTGGVTITGPGIATFLRIAATSRWFFDHVRDAGGLR